TLKTRSLPETSVGPASRRPCGQRPAGRRCHRNPKQGAAVEPAAARSTENPMSLILFAQARGNDVDWGTIGLVAAAIAAVVILLIFLFIFFSFVQLWIQSM